MKIVITPPLWATWYAFLIYGLLLIGVFYAIFHYFNARRRLRGKVANGAERETTTGRVSSGKDASVYEFRP